MVGVLLLAAAPGVCRADNLDTICTGMAVQTALDRYGEPTRVEETEKGKTYWYDDLFGPGSKFFIETDGQDQLVMLVCVQGGNNDCLTSKGISCGSTMGDVEFAYGKPHERGASTVLGKEYFVFIYHIVSLEGAGEQELNLFFERDTRILDMMLLEKRGWH